MKFSEHEASIVIVGALNPAIFQPEWLRNHGLISEPDSESTNINVIHPEITIFDLPWARIDVRQDRFTLRGKDAAFFPMIRDLSVGIFQLLEHSPVNGVGVNSILTYTTNDTKEWHRIGDALVPKEKWACHLKGHIGMTRVSISAERDDDLPGNVNITVAPVVRTGEIGVIVDINNHIELESAGKLPSILNQNWERLQKQARTMADEILEEAAR